MCVSTGFHEVKTAANAVQLIEPFHSQAGAASLICSDGFLAPLHNASDQ
jgi:hypothetical protein